MKTLGYKEGGELGEGLLSRTVSCSNCGWSWNIEPKDKHPYLCHQCGHENTKRETDEGAGPYDAPAYQMEPDHVHFKHQYNEQNDNKGYLLQMGRKSIIVEQYGDEAELFKLASAYYRKNGKVMTIKVLEKAAAMIQEIAGGKCSQVVDVYPNPAEKVKVSMTFAYLKKLSGKQYASDKAAAILTSLGFEILHQDAESIQVAVPYNKPDISIAADLVEEIVRIDGLDNIEIPTAITISPSVDLLETKEQFKNKIANYLVGRGYTEILTNSITNSKYFTEAQLETTVKMLNSL